MNNKIHEFYALEQLAVGNTCIHRLHPLSKLLASAVFIVTVVSFNRYAPDRLVPYILYPLLLMALSETPYTMLFKRFLVALPFCLFAGISNVFLDRTAAFAIGGITISYGLISLITILLKTWLCVMAVLILVSVTAFSQLAGAMRLLRIPNIFIIIFEMTYRYIGLFLNEAYSMGIAYSLRSANSKNIQMKDMGSFAGQLLIRSFDRADRVYNAMKCRGYALQYNLKNSRKFASEKLASKDIFFMVIVSLLCVIFRFVDVYELAAGILGRVL